MGRMIGRRSRVTGCGLGVALFALRAGAGEGCTVGSGFCTSIGCSDETSVTLHTASGTLAAGVYSVEVVAGPLANACTFAVTAPMSDPAQISCSTTATVPGTSPQITIAVARDGQPVGGETLTPQYHAVQPNGAGCAPTCQEAAEDMVVGG